MFMYQIQAGIKWVQPHQLSWGCTEWHTPCDNHTHTFARKIGLGIFILLLLRNSHLKKTRNYSSVVLTLLRPHWLNEGCYGLTAESAQWCIQCHHWKPIICQIPHSDNWEPAFSLVPPTCTFCHMVTVAMADL